MLCIRPAAPEDLSAVAAMHQALYETLVEAYGYPFSYDPLEAKAALAVQLKSRFFGIFVAEADGKLLGFAQGTVSKLERGVSYQGQKAIGRLDNLYVVPDSRSGGIGCKLLCAVKDWLVKQEITVMESYVVSANTPSLAFHQRLGFSPASVRMLCPLEGSEEKV